MEDVIRQDPLKTKGNIKSKRTIVGHSWQGEGRTEGIGRGTGLCCFFQDGD